MNAPVPYVHFASPGVKHAWPNSAACWSPAMPAIGMPSGKPPMPFVVPHTPDEGTTAGRTWRGTPISSHSSSLHASLLISNTSVRDAFVTSVACTAPPVNRHNKNESIVPNAMSPLRAAVASPSTECSIHWTFVPEK